MKNLVIIAFLLVLWLSTATVKAQNWDGNKFE
jgi:hypothetical protein